MSIGATVLAGAVRGYQLVVSPWVTVSCRYYPTCSAYALEAVQLHGAARGSWLALRRLGRCHPWTRGGVDHVPGHAPLHRDEAPADLSAVASVGHPAPSRTSEDLTTHG